MVLVPTLPVLPSTVTDAPLSLPQSASPADQQPASAAAEAAASSAVQPVQQPAMAGDQP